jgi:hypothetical protein
MSLFKENQFVKFKQKIVSDNPTFLMLSSVSNVEQLPQLEFKVKGSIGKGGQVFYVIVRNGMFINNVPEDYLIHA